VLDSEWLGGLAQRLNAQGAIAVVLTGSAARGDAHPESDVDILALGEGPEYRLSRFGGRLVSESWRTPDDVLRAFDSPRDAGYVVPGWRDAVILADPHGDARAIIAAAHAWTWKQLGAERCAAWVAEELTGYAEEVHKLVIALERGARTTAAVQRSVLALRMAQVMAVHLRLLYASENQLWDLVGNRLGEPWAIAQHRALGLDGEPFLETCRAALALFKLACEATSHMLDDHQRAVVDHALTLARVIELG
jgi:hypothetical protein